MVTKQRTWEPKLVVCRRCNRNFFCSHVPILTKSFWCFFWVSFEFVWTQALTAFALLTASLPRNTYLFNLLELFPCSPTPAHIFIGLQWGPPQRQPLAIQLSNCGLCFGNFWFCSSFVFFFSATYLVRPQTCRVPFFYLLFLLPLLVITRFNFGQAISVPIISGTRD